MSKQWSKEIPNKEGFYWFYDVEYPKVDKDLLQELTNEIKKK